MDLAPLLLVRPWTTWHFSQINIRRIWHVRMRTEVWGPSVVRLGLGGWIKMLPRLSCRGHVREFRRSRLFGSRAANPIGIFVVCNCNLLAPGVVTLLNHRCHISINRYVQRPLNLIVTHITTSLCANITKQSWLVANPGVSTLRASCEPTERIRNGLISPTRSVLWALLSSPHRSEALLTPRELFWRRLVLRPSSPTPPFESVSVFS